MSTYQECDQVYKKLTGTEFPYKHSPDRLYDNNYLVNLAKQAGLNNTEIDSIIRCTSICNDPRYDNRRRNNKDAECITDKMLYFSLEKAFADPDIMHCHMGARDGELSNENSRKLDQKRKNCLWVAKYNKSNNKFLLKPVYPRKRMSDFYKDQKDVESKIAKGSKLIEKSIGAVDKQKSKIDKLKLKIDKIQAKINTHEAKIQQETNQSESYVRAIEALNMHLLNIKRMMSDPEILHTRNFAHEYLEGEVAKSNGKYVKYKNLI